MTNDKFVKLFKDALPHVATRVASIDGIIKASPDIPVREIIHSYMIALVEQIFNLSNVGSASEEYEEYKTFFMGVLEQGSSVMPDWDADRMKGAGIEESKIKAEAERLMREVLKPNDKPSIH